MSTCLATIVGEAKNDEGVGSLTGGRPDNLLWWTWQRAVVADDVDNGGCGGLQGRGGSGTDVNLTVLAPARCSSRRQGEGGCGVVGPGGRVTRVGGGGLERWRQCGPLPRRRQRLRWEAAATGDPRRRRGRGIGSAATRAEWRRQRRAEA
uniref:Uncharacterized protein n=1 Tax=Oryza meridionalis TaxID=40149 RepID=A0A0E0F5N6_9ORYZ